MGEWVDEWVSEWGAVQGCPLPQGLGFFGGICLGHSLYLSQLGGSLLSLSGGWFLGALAQGPSLGSPVSCIGLVRLAASPRSQACACPAGSCSEHWRSAPPPGIRSTQGQAGHSPLPSPAQGHLVSWAQRRLSHQGRAVRVSVSLRAGSCETGPGSACSMGARAAYMGAWHRTHYVSARDQGRSNSTAGEAPGKHQQGPV